MFYLTTALASKKKHKQSLSVGWLNCYVTTLIYSPKILLLILQFLRIVQSTNNNFGTRFHNETRFSIIINFRNTQSSNSVCWTTDQLLRKQRRESLKEKHFTIQKPVDCLLSVHCTTQYKRNTTECVLFTIERELFHQWTTLS